MAKKKFDRREYVEQNRERINAYKREWMRQRRADPDAAVRVDLARLPDFGSEYGGDRRSVARERADGGLQLKMYRHYLAEEQPCINDRFARLKVRLAAEGKLVE